MRLGHEEVAAHCTSVAWIALLRTADFVLYCRILSYSLRETRCQVPVSRQVSPDVARDRRPVQTEEYLVDHCRPQVSICPSPFHRLLSKPPSEIDHAQRMFLRVEHFDRLGEYHTGGEFKQLSRKRYANIGLQCQLRLLNRGSGDSPPRDPRRSIVGSDR